MGNENENSRRIILYIAIYIIIIASYTLNSSYKCARAGDYFSLSGMGGSSTGLFAYQGVIGLPLGSFETSGPVFRAWGKTFAFNYRTDIIDPNVEAMPIKGVIISAQAFAVEAEAGYQIAGPWGRFALLAGGSYRDYLLSPNDNRSPFKGNHFGAKIAVDGALGAPEGFGASFNGSYITGLEEYWAQVRPRYRWQSGLEAGVDLAAFGGTNYDYGRIGLFASGFDLTPWGAEKTYLGMEIGGESAFDLKTFGGYGAIHIGFGF